MRTDIFNRPLEKVKRLKNQPSQPSQPSQPNLSGGDYVAHGVSKCVVDADDQNAVCAHHAELFDAKHVAQYVKIVLSKRDFDKEVKLVGMLRQAVDKQHVLTHSIADNIGVCLVKQNATEMIDPTNQKRAHCGVGKYSQPTQLVAAVVKRLHKLGTVITKQNVCLIYDVLHALYQFAKQGYAHLDVKRKNVMVDDNIAKLIDFGWTKSYDTILAGNKTLASKSYPYWPSVLSSISKLSKAQKAQIESLKQHPDQMAELMQAIDKFGFAMMLLQTEQHAEAFQYHTKKPTIDMFQMLSKLRAWRCDTNQPFNEWDVHYNSKFYSWKQIYANLQDCFGVPGPDLDDYYKWLASRQTHIL